MTRKQTLNQQRSPVLRCREVSKRYGGNEVLTGISLDVEEGEILAVVGPNGAGKSTLLKSVFGTVEPSSGSIHLLGEEVTSWAAHKRAKFGCSVTFQTPLSSEDLTIEEQLFAQSLSFTHIRSPRSRHLVSRIAQLVEAAEIGSILERRTGELTLGELRRFEMARALVNQPALLLIDEPASGMTASEAQALSSSVRSVAKSGVAVVLVEHNIPFVRATAPRALALDAGRLLASGTTGEVLSSPELKEAYLGNSAV